MIAECSKNAAAPLIFTSEPLSDAWVTLWVDSSGYLMADTGTGPQRVYKASPEGIVPLRAPDSMIED